MNTVCNESLPEYVVLNPGEEVHEKNRAWQGCPTVAVTKGGRIFAGWYTGGMFEPCIDNYNVLVYSDNEGESWSAPIAAIYTDYKNMHRNIDIQLWVDEYNRLWVMWTHSPYYNDSKKASIRTPFTFNYHKEFPNVEGMICRDPDASELVFESPKIICEGFLRCKPIIRNNGDYIFPAYDWIHKDNYVLRVSKDKGESFETVIAAPKPKNNVYDETAVYETGTTLSIIARTNLGYYLESHSDNALKSWSSPCEYEKAPSTRLYMGRLSTGQLIYVRSISDTKRQGMKVCLSDDDGKSWPYTLVLDTRENLSYPDLSEDGKGNIYIVYDRERDNRIRADRENWTSDAAKEILLCKITVNDIISAEISGNSFSEKVISKAEICTIEK